MQRPICVTIQLQRSASIPRPFNGLRRQAGVVSLNFKIAIVTIVAASLGAGGYIGYRALGSHMATQASPQVVYSPRADGKPEILPFPGKPTPPFSDAEKLPAEDTTSPPPVKGWNGETKPLPATKPASGKPTQAPIDLKPPPRPVSEPASPAPSRQAEPQRASNMSEELADCEKQSFFTRITCREKVRWKHCQGRWDEVPGCETKHAEREKNSK